MVPAERLTGVRDAMFIELLGLRPGSAAGPRRFCYVQAERLEALLTDPLSVELLRRELGDETPRSATPAENIAQLRRQAIRWSLAVGSPYFGLSVEEIVVMSAYRSLRFDGAPWRRCLVRPYTHEELLLAGRRWLRESALAPDGRLHPWRGRWLIGKHPVSQRTVALTFALEARRLRHELGWLACEADFAHETYLVCSLPTALAFIDADAKASRTQRVCTQSLEHPLRLHGLGLLLVDTDETFVVLAARARELLHSCRT